MYESTVQELIDLLSLLKNKQCIVTMYTSEGVTSGKVVVTESGYGDCYIGVESY